MSWLDQNIKISSRSRGDTRMFRPVLVPAAFLLAIMSSSALGQKAADPELAALAATADRLARDEMTTRWYPATLNRERGGFHQSYARDWTKQPDDSAFLVYQARMVWTAAAFAAYAPERKDEFLQYARHGLDFLDTVMRDREKGGFFWSLAPDGSIDPKVGDRKHVYAISFVIYAGARLREVGGDEKALAVARDAFDWLEAHAHDAKHGGYFEDLARDGTPIRDWSNSGPGRNLDRMGAYPGFKSMNAHIHLLEAVTALSRVDDRPVVRERLEELLTVVRDRIAVEPGALNLFLTPDWRAVPGHDSFGHDVETAFLLVEAAEALGRPDDAKTWTVARSLVDHALDWGWDGQHGGFYDKGETFDGAVFDTDKVWWTQAEGLNALALMHVKFGADTPRYREALLKQWSFITNHQIDATFGGWFNETTREGKPLGDGAKVTPWKANYHTSRALMNVARLLGAGGPHRD
jgi:mannobiose 2-epimerase